MIKVKIERPDNNVFYVEDGVVVQYAGEGDGILEVLDEEDAVIAVFRDWIYALPITDEEYLIETGQLEEDQDDSEEISDTEASLLVNANGHGEYGLLDDGEESF